MKYPLSLVNALIDCYGSDIGLGYDIMCAFHHTLKKSKKLGHKVAAMQLQGVVPAFHGHAHNQKCQLFWHPTYIPGLGIFDFEECELTFALSNCLANTTRLSTTFH